MWCLFILLALMMIVVLLFWKPLVHQLWSCDTKHIPTVTVFSHEDNHPYLSYFNPSMIPFANGYLIAVRRSAWNNRHLWALLQRSFLPNRSYLEFFHVDAKFRLLSRTKPYLGDQSYIVEDPRICRWNDKIYVVATLVTEDIFPVLLEFNSSLQLLRRIKIDSSSFRHGSRITEKNWCPFIVNDQLYLHTDTAPIWRIRRLDPETGEISTVVEWDSRSFFREIPGFVRCSTSLIPYTDTTYLCGVHTHVKHGRKVEYRTILIEVDKTSLIPLRRTKPLCLRKDHTLIQFLSGLLVMSNQVVLGIGVGNYRFELHQVDRHYLESIFE